MRDPRGDEPTPYDKLPEINSYDEIPAFENEDEEDFFWSTHALGPGILDSMSCRPLSEMLQQLEELKRARAKRGGATQQRG